MEEFLEVLFKITIFPEKKIDGLTILNNEILSGKATRTKIMQKKKHCLLTKTKIKGEAFAPHPPVYCSFMMHLYIVDYKYNVTNIIQILSKFDLKVKGY